MTRTPLKSSHLQEVGYDPETRTMEIKFSTGHAYTYDNVDAKQHEALLAAESPGKHWREHMLSSLKGTRMEAKKDG